jgi:phosphatidylserine/phosphatidylglycerophosphate/cardiolipin synthase-like enzyme
VQVTIFNSPSRSPFTVNRRSHDKLLVVDGFSPEHALVITGGRNISLAYYGILADGSPNPDTYNDAEILLRSGDYDDVKKTVGVVSEVYFSLLSLHDANKRVTSRQFVSGTDMYGDRRRAMRLALVELKSLERLQPYFEDMETFLANDWHEAEVRLAHEFANLTNEAVITDAVANMSNNPNSIMYQLNKARDLERTHSRIVSPYLFLARYYDSDGNLLLDEAQRILEWLAEAPDHRYEMITNSVLTSDNAPAQSVVDMDMAPRMFLGEEYKKVWQDEVDADELSHELVDSETWRELVNHPQLSIYETGRLDDVALGGDKHYGKLHSKYLIGDEYGFIGTANFDYRSRLFNNEMGFFFAGEELRQDLIEDFELLKSESYLWGSPEWLEMRRQVMKLDGIKGASVRNQRSIFRTLRATGLEYQF